MDSLIPFFDPIRGVSMTALVIKILLSVFFGGLIGLERGQKHRAAGSRTYMIVCLGAALTMILSQYENELLITVWKDISEAVGIKTDVSRFGAQVINGIGFLGAGTILVTGHQQVTGLTTAAGLWASACTGLAVGAGFYEGVLVAFPLIFLSIRVFPIVDVMIQEFSRDINLYIEFSSINQVGEIINHLKAQDVQIYEVDIERGREKQSRNPSAFFSVRMNQKQTHSQLLSNLAGLDGICVIEEI